MANGRISLTPGTKKNIKAFIQWARDLLRVGDDPQLVAFPVANANMYIRQYKTHESFQAKAKTITETAKPPKLSESTNWEEWCPVFLNFLRAIPGRNGVPLKYVCRDNDLPLFIPGAEMLEDYVNCAPLNGESYELDAAEVHTYIVNFVAGNATAEAKILPHVGENNGCLDFIALREHYEGVGVNSIEMIKADKVLNSLYYAGEKKPHMWWEEFEKQLTKAFAVYHRNEGRQVHSDAMKLRILVQKVNADFLQTAKSSINIELTCDPMNNDL